VPRLMARSYSRSRGSLATTLTHLIETAQVNVIPADGQKPVLAGQYGALQRAARDLQIDDGAALSGFLCNYLPALPDLIAKIEGASPSRFRKTHRPHGLLIAVIADASVGHLRHRRRYAACARTRGGRWSRATRSHAQRSEHASTRPSL
jgi:hypothetical protein